MLTLWALATTLAVQAEALDLQTPPSLLEKLPVKRPLPLPGQFHRYPPTSNDSPPTKHLAETPPVANLCCFHRGQSQCSQLMMCTRIAAQGFMVAAILCGGKPSASTCSTLMTTMLQGEHVSSDLNTTLNPQIEKMLMCAEVDLGGVLGTVLNTVSNLDVLSLLDLTSSLNILGDDGLSGILGKGSNNKSSKSPLPLLPKVTDAVSNLIPLAQGALDGLLRNIIGGILQKADYDSSLLSNLPVPLSGVLNKVGELKESTKGVLKYVEPGGINDALSSVLGNINVKDLLMGLQVQKASVENRMWTMTGDEILIQAMTTTFIGGKGLVGPIISLLGFQVNSGVILNIGIFTNNDQCVSLQVQDKDIKAKRVYLQLVKTVTDILPLPVPLP
ncbi:LOW QUALITY PROTEIN: vomeromodulin-like [Molossus nigricans]